MKLTAVQSDVLNIVDAGGGWMTVEEIALLYTKKSRLGNGGRARGRLILVAQTCDVLSVNGYVLKKRGKFKSRATA